MEEVYGVKRRYNATFVSFLKSANKGGIDSKERIFKFYQNVQELNLIVVFRAGKDLDLDS